jgi:serine/threonine protein kinase
MITKNTTTVVKYLMEHVKDRLEIEEELSYHGFDETRTSYLFIFTTSKCSVMGVQKIVAKLYKMKRSVDVPCNPSGNEYKFLKQLNYVLFDIPQLVIPRPIARLPKINCIIIEWVDGISLQKLMPAGGRFGSEDEKRMLEAHFRNAGKAIGLIQSRTHGQNAGKAKSYMDAKLRSIKKQAQHSYLKNYCKYIERALKCIDEAIPTISWGKVGSAWTHGDFVCSNILITNEGKIAILDLAESRFDSPYHDISRFTVRTIIDYGYVWHKYSSSYLHGLNHNFLNGYLSSFPHKISDDLLVLYDIFNLLQFISFLYEPCLRSFLSLRDWYALFLLRKKCMQMCPIGEPK